MGEAAVEETMPVLCETSLSVTIPREKDSPGVKPREGSTRIEDGAAKGCQIWSGNFNARCTHTSRQSHLRAICVED